MFKFFSRSVADDRRSFSNDRDRDHHCEKAI